MGDDQAMVRLLVLVEGQTEENFVNCVLSPYLYPKGFTSISAKLLGNARNRSHRGGIRPWNGIREEITKYLKEDPIRYVSTMVDYYALPNSWPGRVEANRLIFSQKTSHIEKQIHKEITKYMGDSWNPKYFIPYIMIHEFESLLFSDCEKFAASLGQPELANEFQKIREQYDSPEEINDSPQTHPSRQIQNLFPTYQKPLHGAQSAQRISIKSMLEDCPNFRRWLEKLSLLSTAFGY